MLFTANYQQLRRSISILPPDMEDPLTVSTRLAQLYEFCPGVTAFDQGQLAGYMGWYQIDRYRNTHRRAA